ncbi:MAG: glycosyl hydrolase family 18 protein [Candidatus Staskawiczbacteria bacterium]|nr:glycosyl hydrolase family 18 protein [Candidatus Staskawiczbacteria bacterium]
MLKKILVFFFCFVIFIVPSFCLATQAGSASSMEKIFYMSQAREKVGIVSLKKNADKIDILAPQFFAISDKLKLVGSLDANLKKIISQKKIKVMPLVANTGFKQSVIHNLLLSKTAQDAVIKSFVVIATKEKYIGWQFDFENINYLDKDLYSAFVEKTAKALHKNGLILSVAVVSRSVDYEDTDAFKNWGGAFDYERLAKATDFISLMTYDDPNSLGPVASIPFIDKTLAYVKDKIPPEKLSFGIPLYNWGWSKDPFKRVNASGTYDGLLYIKSNFQHELGFNEVWLSYSYNNKQYNIWYQNGRSFENKLDIIKQNNFRGFSAWVMGVEDPEIWSTLNNTKK